MNQVSESVILVVDDDPTSLRMLFDHLRQADFKVLVAENGVSAMKRIERSRPDMVLLDVNLPDIDGFELCRRLKDRYPEPDITVMFLTMYADIGDKLKGLDLGAVDYMTKPFQVEEVVARVERHLALRNLQKRLEERNIQLEHEVAEHKRTEEKLRASEAKMRALFASLTDVIFVLDRHGRYIDIAPVSPDLFYRPVDEVLGKSVHEVFPKQRADMFLNAVHTCLDTQQTVSLEYSLIIGDAELWFDGRISPMSDDTVVVVARDITAQKQAREQLHSAKLEAETAQRLAEKERALAETANQAKSVFLASMSHKLRTPLNAILGYAQLLARDPHITPPHDEYLATVIRSGEHLLGLINDVLTMSKIGAGRITLQENAFDLHQQLDGLQRMFRARANEKCLALRVDVTPDVPRYIHADEGKLRQVLMNLIGNAVKFTDEGSVTLRVGCHVLEADRGYGDNPDFPTPIQLCFEIEDTGVGIASEEIEALFAPFAQTINEQQSQSGTGLGLPISRQFVDLMGGELRVESVVGQGTLFYVQIPVFLTTEDEAQTVEFWHHKRVIGVEPDQTAPDGGPFRLLIIEDKPTNRDLLIELLAPLGFDLDYATNGTEGVELWETWQPHLTWINMRMSGIDGYETARQIKTRADSLGYSAIIIAITSTVLEADRQAIFAAGCDEIVRKPILIHEIFDVLHRYLGIRFIYESSSPEQATGVTLKDLSTLIEGLPATWVTDLYQAIVALDTEQMLALVETIRPQAPQLADILGGWIRDFKYDKLMELVAPGM